MGIVDFFKKILGDSQPKRIVPLHRFNDFTLEEIELIEEGLQRSVTAKIKLMEQGFVTEQEKDRWRLLCLLFEEASVVTSIERGRRMHF